MTSTDTTTDTTTEVDATAEVDATPEVEETPEAPEVEETTGGREAARYRRRLRETETERDGLRLQLEDAQRSMIEAIAAAAGRLQRPAVLWAAGATVEGLLDDHGNVDPDRVLAACETAATEFGVSRAPRPNYVPSEGTNPTGRGAGDGMAAVIAGR